jgi:hypothetical protein
MRDPRRCDQGTYRRVLLSDGQSSSLGLRNHVRGTSEGGATRWGLSHWLVPFPLPRRSLLHSCDRTFACVAASVTGTVLCGTYA